MLELETSVLGVALMVEAGAFEATPEEHFSELSTGVCICLSCQHRMGLI